MNLLNIKHAKMNLRPIDSMYSEVQYKGITYKINLYLSRLTNKSKFIFKINTVFIKYYYQVLIIS